MVWQEVNMLPMIVVYIVYPDQCLVVTIRFITSLFKAAQSEHLIHEIILHCIISIIAYLHNSMRLN